MIRSYSLRMLCLCFRRYTSWTKISLGRTPTNRWLMLSALIRLGGPPWPKLYFWHNHRNFAKQIRQCRAADIIVTASNLLERALTLWWLWPSWEIFLQAFRMRVSPPSSTLSATWSSSLRCLLIYSVVLNTVEERSAPSVELRILVWFLVVCISQCIRESYCSILAAPWANARPLVNPNLTPYTRGTPSAAARDANGFTNKISRNCAVKSLKPEVISMCLPLVPPLIFDLAIDQGTQRSLSCSICVHTDRFETCSCSVVLELWARIWPNPSWEYHLNAFNGVNHSEWKRILNLRRPEGSVLVRSGNKPIVEYTFFRN